MDPLNNTPSSASSSLFNSTSHRSAPSIPHQTLNIQNIHNASSSSGQHTHHVPLPAAAASSSSNANASIAGVGGVGGGGGMPYSTSYSHQGAANNAQFHNISTANSTQQHQQQGAFGQPMPMPPMQAHQHHQQPPPPFAAQYEPRTSTAGVRSPVPNPLGMGGGGGGAPASNSSSTSGPVPAKLSSAPGPIGPTHAQTELLRSMYHSRQQHMPSSSQQPFQGQVQVVQGGSSQGMQPSYRAPSTSTSMPTQQQQQRPPNHTYANNAQSAVHQQQQQPRSSSSVFGNQVQQQQQGMPSSYHHSQQPAAQQHTQPIPLQQRQQLPSQSMQSHQHQSQPLPQQVRQQVHHHHPPLQQQQQQQQQHTYHPYDHPSQQHVQPVQGTTTSQPHHHPQQQQLQQQKQSRNSHPSQQQSSTEQTSSSSSSSQPQPQVKQRFHLTPEAKAALREAVLSAIRHPNGTIDPACLQRAMAQGLPEKAILNAAVVARERDRRNREERARQGMTTGMGGQGLQPQGQESQQRQQEQQQQQAQQLGVHSSKPKQGTVVHHPGMPRPSQQQQQQQQPAPYYTQQPLRPNTTAPTTSSLTKPQNLPTYYGQNLASSSDHPNRMPTYYGQNLASSSDHPHRMYQQEQQPQQQQQQQHLSQPSNPNLLQQPKLSDQEMAYQRQYHAQQQQQQQQAAAEAAAAKQQRQQQEQQRRSQEEARRQQINQNYQLEQQKKQKQQQEQQQKRLAEEQRKRKEAEMAQRLAREVAAQRNGELAARMKGWGRTGFGLVVKENAKGLPRQQQQQGQQTTTTYNGVLRQCMWGGASLCLDGEPALVSAVRRARGDKDEPPPKSHSSNVQLVVDSIRKQLILQQPSSSSSSAAQGKVTHPLSKDELRRKRTRAISLKLMDSQRTHTHLKRLKLQPKRESKFLDKHIRRARQLTADAHSKRHKELLKAIVTHQTEFYKYHRWKKNECAKVARSIRDSLRKAEVAKEKEAESAEKARLAALRANDMAAYTSLLEDTKNERLKYLLDKTDECMNQISNLLASRVAEEEEDIKNMGGEGTIQATFTQDVTGGSYYETAHVKSEQVRQPSLLVGGELKEYQLSGLQWLVSLYNNRLNGILADEMGLGKTIQTISLIAYLIEAKQILGPYLVIVPLSTLSNWVNEFAKWLPAATVVCYKGTPQQRKQLYRDEVADGHFNVLLTTYEFVIRDKGSLKKIAWQYAIVDEGHRMKNNQSKFAVTLGTQYHTRRRVLLTGTPLQNNLPELWALLNFLLPAIFNSAETFDQWFNKPFSSFGKTSAVENGDDSSNELLSNEERMLIIHRLHELLRPFMLRRIKSEVLDQLPEKVEKVLRCELSSWQKELYKQISHKIAGEAATKNFNRGLNNVVMQLRKVCNHPLLFSQDGYHINDDIIRASGKVELLDRMLPKLKAAGHRVLMFTQMTKMMPILEDYFAYRGFSSLRLDGSTTADEREKRMYMFNAPDSPYFIFLLSTRAGGLGLNLATADTVIIFDSDWNPMMDLQAQDRAHRIGQRKDVRVFRIITQSPVEEKILSRATEKLQMNELVVEAGKFDKSGQDKDDNSLERLKMMELLLHDFDQNQNAQSAATSEEDFEKDTDDGGEEESKDLLNEMISSNDDDYELYCEMDRNRTDAPALYTDVADCPDWILYPNGKPEPGAEPVDAELFGKRRAAAGEKIYDDGLTEKQFCRLMDKHAVEDEKGKKKRKKKRNRNAVDPSLILDYDGSGGRKRIKTTPLQLDEATPRSKASFSSNSGSGNGEITIAMYERLLSVTRSIIYLKDKGTKRKLSEIFLEKPCPQTYPDYYQLIEKPIGMNDILRKCRAKLYSSVNDFRDDWNTLFKNAFTYNGEGSWIVNDAEVLRGELDRLIEKNDLNKVDSVKVVKANTPAPVKKPVRIKLSLKVPKKKKDTQDDSGSESGASTPAQMKTSESQSELSNRFDSEAESESSDSDSDND